MEVLKIRVPLDPLFLLSVYIFLRIRAGGFVLFYHGIKSIHYSKVEHPSLKPVLYTCGPEFYLVCTLLTLGYTRRKLY